MSRNIFYGTAGWAIPREQVDSFPKEGSGIERYSAVLPATEINTTFRRRHRRTTFERWAASVPESFRFAVKLPSAITHDSGLRAPRQGLEEFLDDVEGLGARLGPILVQLPPALSFDARTAGTFFRILRQLHTGPVACEPRHQTWYTLEATRVFDRHAIARVLADPPRPSAAHEPGGDPTLLYIRLHGSPRRYYSSYDDDRLAAVAERIRAVPPWATAWCVFDNTASGAATGDALRFAARVGRETREASLRVRRSLPGR